MKYLPNWTAHERDAAKAYEDTLSSLKENSKPVINTLTELANEYGREFPHIIVYCIEERIKEVQTEIKLPVLYLMDSIVKNHPEQYKKLFARNLVDTFVHVFSKSNERTRSLLFKLRSTWNDYFLPAVLTALDQSVKKIDPAWPIATPKAQTNNIHINPAVFARQTNTTNNIDKDSLSAKLQQKELELMALKLKRMEAEKEALERKLSEQKTQVSNDGNSASNDSDRNRKNSRQRPDSTQNSTSRRGNTEVRILPSSEKSRKTTEKSTRSSSSSPTSPRPRSRSPLSKSNPTSQKTYRIPKKTGSSPAESKTESNRKRGSKGGTKNQRHEKKVKLNHDLFGDESHKPHGMQSQGWAKFKEVNPDEFRTPMQLGPGQNRRPPPMELHQLGPNNRPRADPRLRNNGPRFQENFDNRNRIPTDLMDPDIVLNKVIPMITKQAQENLSSGMIDSTQFSDMMKNTMQLKEEAHMRQADKLAHDNGHSQRQPLHRVPGRIPPIDGGLRQGRNLSGLSDPKVGGQPVAANKDLPNATPEELEMIARDPVTTLDIDGHPRPIRFYGETATIIMSPTDVRELTFKHEGFPMTRRVIIDNNLTIELTLNSRIYTTFILDNKSHSIKLGSPSRELWIDGLWYQCFFNESIMVSLGNPPRMHEFFLQGPPPNVNIGLEPMLGLCLGTVQVIVDGNIHNSTVLYLDAKPQVIEIAGKPHVLRFVEGISTLLINGHPYKTRFGSTPMVVYVNQQPHYVRLTSLPDGISLTPNALKGHEPMMPLKPLKFQDVTRSPEMDNENSQDNGSFENRAFDRFVSMLPSPKVDTMSAPSRLSQQYSMSENDLSKGLGSGPVTGSKPDEKEPFKAPSTTQAEFDVTNFLAQLAGAGLISSTNKVADSIPGLETGSTPTAKAEPSETPSKKKATEPVKAVNLKSHDKSLKEHQPGLITKLFNPSALQCKNCGLRFNSEDIVIYSQHLDWHFRINRREKDKCRKAQSRPWFLDKDAWIQSDELEDEEKAQAEEAEVVKEAEVEAIPSVPVSSDPEKRSCPVCHEDFEEFYNQDSGAWNFRNAVESEGFNYHSLCLEDSQKQVNDASMISEDDQPSSTVEPQIKVEEVVEELKVEDIEPDSDLKDESEELKEEEKVEIETPTLEMTDPEPVVKIEKDEVDMQVEEVVKKEEVEMDEETLVEKVEVKQELEEQEDLNSSQHPEEEPESNITLERSLDENALAEVSSAFTAPTLTVTTSIKINLTTTVEPPKTIEHSESVISNSSDLDGNLSQATDHVEEDSEFDIDAIVQKVDRETKPKLKDRKLRELPMQQKGQDLSGLCSIM